MPVKILMVCLGNICRSPLAEGILRSKLDSNFIIDSAGTGGWHAGESPDQRSIETAKQNNIDISHQKARKFSIADFDSFDYIYVMDQSNYKDVINLAPNKAAKAKVALILSDSKKFQTHIMVVKKVLKTSITYLIKLVKKLLKI